MLRLKVRTFLSQDETFCSASLSRNASGEVYADVETIDDLIKLAKEFETAVGSDYHGIILDRDYPNKDTFCLWVYAGRIE